MTVMTDTEAMAHVMQTNPAFAVTDANIRGVDFRVFENVPPHVAALLHASYEAQGNGAAEYLIFENERWTFDEFLSDVNRMAHVLRDTFGVTKGAPVGIAMRNCPELMIMVMACASIGAVTVFVNAWWTTEELEYALKDSGARLVFADGDRVARMQPLVDDLGLAIVGVRDGETTAHHSFTALKTNAQSDQRPDADIDTDDDFAIMYSSGTTGRPKGVVQTHRGAVNAVFSWLITAVMAPLMDPDHDPDAPPVRPSVLIVTPLFHVTATHPMFLLSLPAGAKVAVMPKWDARKAVEIIRDEKITRFLGVPTQSADLMVAMREMGETLPTLDYIGAGGAKRPPAQVGELSEMLPNAAVATGWGMTETNALGIGMLGDEYNARPDACGKPHGPLQDVRFLDDNGNDVPHGEIGELTVKSPANMRCYLNKPDATAEVLEDGWLKTGDLGRIDDEGYVSIVDRKKNIIIRGGENIACLDVEAALHRHPAVAEACAFSVPHDRLGEVVGAGIQLKSGTSAQAEDIQAFLADHIAKFKIPEHIWFQTTPLPRGATDKTDRRALQAQCLKDHT
ncbi:Long-chain-fatty-acid--CoA ligase FadD13 [Ascidiaceihabitans donghaensis]|uniref:Long-chain-fatty-acid--CoA ligase FadD13 n=1 Tax=Ascidiaceihabitans donghaensis TaxID=1510460 RepID=A0A2R8BEE4_9RHOB|nr:class I adenylate-forming enzyme family protein [Ascidiaceihabitans donghaensis]SPH21430.1 Long-chain-fatty-acid--CoA ligase FadD13 [Ascidiaceihabitans donghaensis]